MGKTKLIHYIIRKKKTAEFVAPFRTRKSVNAPSHGRPTSENLSKWRDSFNKSLLKGGANEHLGTKHWLQCTLEIYDQKEGKVVCEYVAPMFEIIKDIPQEELTGSEW